jgi:hypothetical protein
VAEFKQYDPGLTSFTWGPIQPTMFADGTFIVVEYEADAFSKRTGSGGDTVRTRQRNRSGSITLTLLKEDPANSLIMAIAKIDQESGLGVRPALVRNLNSTALAAAPSAWVRKIPNLEFADVSGVVEWVFDIAGLELQHGGALI